MPVVQGATNLTATYTLTSSTDRSDTCAGSPAAVAPSNLWINGTFAKTNDADWYRFKMTKAGKIRLVLGDLTTGGPDGPVQRLLDAPADLRPRRATASEEIIRSLAAGTYAVKLTGSGTGSTPPYVIRMRALPATRPLSFRPRPGSRAARSGSIGELYNNTTKTVGSTKVTAKLYNASNVLLATRTAYADLSYMTVGSRRRSGSSGRCRPATTTRSTRSVRRRPHGSIGAPTPSTTTNGLNGSGQYVVAGTVKNPYTKTVTTLWVAVTLYDGRGSILDAARAQVGTTTLGALKSTTFSATFIPLGLAPNKVYVRGMVFR